MYQQDGQNSVLKQPSKGAKSESKRGRQMPIFQYVFLKVFTRVIYLKTLYKPLFKSVKNIGNRNPKKKSYKRKFYKKAAGCFIFKRGNCPISCCPILGGVLVLARWALIAHLSLQATPNGWSEKWHVFLTLGLKICMCPWPSISRYDLATLMKAEIIGF